MAGQHGESSAAQPGLAHGAEHGTSPRARLRAVLIAVVLLAQCVTATPNAPLTAEQLARPEGQRTLQRLEAGLARLSLRPSRDALARELLAWSQRGVRLRAAVLAPFAALSRVAELDQRVALFTGTRRETSRLHVDGRDARGRWHALHRAPGGDDALARRLRYRRLRALYNPSLRYGPRHEYPGFGRWLARELLGANDALEAVRLRIERLELGAPGTPARRLRYEHTLLHRRSELP
jgi:hypothetical protein